MTVITTTEHIILDSSGQPAEGRILFTQSARGIVDGNLVTTTPGTVTVRRGRIDMPRVFDLPPTGEGEGVLVVEMFRNRGAATRHVSYWVEVPDEESIEYADLPQITSPTAGPGVPSWAAELLAALEDIETLNDAAMTAVLEDDGSSTNAKLAADIADPDTPVGGAIAATIASSRQIAGVDPVGLETLSTHADITDAQLTIPTYDGSGVVVHPSVIHIPTGWQGKRWWLAMTPYPSSNNAYENPSILCSDDGVTWAAPSGLTNPVIAKPSTGYNSDPSIVIGPDNLMHMWFRQENTGTATSYIKHTQSADGVTWSTPDTIYTESTVTGVLVSPAFFHDGDSYVMIAVVNTSGTDYIVRAASSHAASGWPAYSTVTVNGTLPNDPFHIDARMAGGVVIACIKCDANSSGRNYLAYSTDGGATLTVARFAGWGYKYAILPMLTPSGLALKVMYGSLAGAMRWANWTAGGTPDILQAIYQKNGFVAADSFHRADGTSLGTSDTGHSWTVISGTPGISSFQAYPSVSGNTRAYIETGVADAIASVIIPTITASVESWMTFRLTDGSNYFRLGFNGNFLQLQRVQSGTPTNLWTANATLPAASGVRLTARFVGSSITVLVDDAPVITVTDSFNSTATKVGIMFSNTSARLSELTVRSLA